MSEENGTPKSEARPTAEDKPAEGATTPTDAEAEKAAKIAAAKAKAAAKKAAAAEDEPPKEPWEDKPVPPEHEDAADDPDVSALTDAVAGAVVVADRYAGDVTVTVPPEKMIEACRFLKEEKGYAFLVDLTAVDWPEREEGRFDVIYWMHRFEDNKRLRVRVVLPEDQEIPSATAVWKGASWLEREAYDMFGVIFAGHPGLERILTWEGFNGHPLRKDFPVEGIDTGAAIYPDVYPEGCGPVVEEKGEAQ